MKKRYLLTAVIALLSVMATSAQTLTITTNSGSKQFSASDITSSSPATFTSNGTRMSISGNTYTVSDIISALVACENHGYVKETCSECGGDTHCTRCHGTGIGCTVCNGTGKYCRSCGTSGKDVNCGGSGRCSTCGGTGKFCGICNSTGKCGSCNNGKCNKCSGSGKMECSDCHGTANCWHCAGTGKVGNTKCTTCNGNGRCTRCNGSRKEQCNTCYGSGKCGNCSGSGKCYSCHGNPTCGVCSGNRNCRYCGGSGTCTVCSGKPQCSTCGGDGHCAKCKNSDGKCTGCSGLGYNWKDIILSSNSLDLSYLGESTSLSITINQSWNATCSATWITLKDAEGKNSGKLTITADANPTEKSRSATIIIKHAVKTEYVSIKQEGIPAIELSKEKVDFDATPTGSQTITVTCNRDWSASSSEEWLTVSPTGKNGGSYLTLTATNNPTMDERHATVTFSYADKTKSIDVKQAAGEGTIEVAMPVTICPHDGDTLLLVVKASSRREWTVIRSSDATWLHFDTVDNTSQTYSESGSKLLMVIFDKSTEVTARICQLTIVSGSYTNTITVAQSAAPMNLSNMLQKPFGFIDVSLMNDSFNNVYTTLANNYNLTEYSNSYYVEVYKNALLTGISYCGLLLDSFRGGRSILLNNPEYTYYFFIEKSQVSNINPYIEAIYNDFQSIGITKFKRYDYSDYFVYSAYYDNATYSFYVHSKPTYYRIDISVEYK